ncbi:MAG: hypothetical protein Q4C91_11520 [Eubacteriales bacterium]|nr:hypothetical protein [Eubacteriales bacterium]
MSLSHAATRKAYGMAIDGVLKYVNKDREKNLLKLVDISEKFLGSRFRQEVYDGARELIQDKDGKWMKFLYRALDELDPHVFKTLPDVVESGISGGNGRENRSKIHRYAVSGGGVAFMREMYPVCRRLEGYGR